MRTVRDPSGKRYLLVKEAAESSRIRDPETGEEHYRSNAELEPEAGDPPLRTAATGVPAAVRRAVLAVSDERTLGLLIELVDRGPLSVQSLLDSYELCESDLHGVLAEFRAAGLVTETTVGGERGYQPTTEAREAVATIRVDEGPV